MSVTSDQCQLNRNLYAVLRSDWIPEEVKLKIRRFIPEWVIHIKFQAKVLKQLKSKQPLLRGFFPLVNPRMLEESDQWNGLEFDYADRLPALVPQDEWEQYETENRFLEGRAFNGPYVPADWRTTVRMFRHN